MNSSFSIIHLSDLHFGRIQSATLEHLDHFMEQRKAQIKIAIVTGDLTQRARKKEFLAAKDFITSLDSPLFVVPGNHDVPLYNLFLRFLSPYKKFLRYLGPFAQNYYEDEQIAIFGLWTVDNFSVKNGKLRKRDLQEITEKFRAAPEHKIKIVACHHPLFKLDQSELKVDVKELMKLSPHFFLWGHEHQSGITSLHENELFPIVLASGTTTSSRTRVEANSFNYITFDNDKLMVEIFRHSKLLGGFEVIDERIFKLDKRGGPGGPPHEKI
jgi:3',5'-cyclic AMP phosphodiesterase CpdA